MKTAEILLVDDDASLLQMLPDLIRSRMPKVRVVSEISAQHAVSRIHIMKYDAIVSDFSMPEMNGLALLEEVKKAQPLTPFLLMTGVADESFRATAKAAGAQAVLQKPFHPDDFMIVLCETLEHTFLWQHLDAQERLLAQITRHLSAFQRRQLAEPAAPLLFLQQTQELTRRLIEILQCSVACRQDLYEGVVDLKGSRRDSTYNLRIDSLRRQAALLGVHLSSKRSAAFCLPRRRTGAPPSRPRSVAKPGMSDTR
jgi:DNA-binding response OmpR family regulator